MPHRHAQRMHIIGMVAPVQGIQLIGNRHQARIAERDEGVNSAHARVQLDGKVGSAHGVSALAYLPEQRDLAKARFMARFRARLSSVGDCAGCAALH
ncbi:hypothetical protein OR16_30834 [Cupriavidus basilensis OR16]|uniref:Uncharacterized protein n=1 Tax=Cupriavidus basilensis OR16 TaxID=1127483 RepID=H1SD43_9BURK|nr:hypothetical protein OR16_30834 [Cupriavidus basilensis OR16]